MKAKVLVGAALSMLLSAAIADDAARKEAERIIEMKDGSTLYIFKDKKMAMTDKGGRPTRMKQGQVMETKDGQRIIMVGDEVARLDVLLKDGHQ